MNDILYYKKLGATVKRTFNYLFIALLIGILVQGFQCASPDMTTAKIAIKNKDFAKAKLYLEKELSKNPSNEEAWMSLAEVQWETKDLDAASTSLVNGLKHFKDPKFKDQALRFRNTLWVECFNKGYDNYIFYFDLNKSGKKDEAQSKLDSAMYYINTGIKIMPEMPDFYQLLGGVYEVKTDTVKAIQAYNKYAELLNDEINFAKEKGIYINQLRSEAIKGAGKPDRSVPKSTNPETTDTLITDYYNVNGKDIFLFSTNKKNPNYSVMGWKVDPPSDWLKYEREQPASIQIDPYITLAQLHYNMKNYDKALENIKKIILLDPSNADANTFMVQIYEIQGKKNESVKYIEDLVNKDPKNKLYRRQYGDILFQTEKIDEAIAQYRKALEIDANYEPVICNLAASLKNKVAKIQQKQQQEDRNEPEEYQELLKESAANFEKCKQTMKDLTRVAEILGELYEIYFVLNDNEKAMQSLKTLEGYESALDEEPKAVRERYYFGLIKYYDRLKTEYNNQLMRSPNNTEIEQKKNEYERKFNECQTKINNLK